MDVWSVELLFRTYVAASPDLITLGPVKTSNILQVELFRVQDDGESPDIQRF
jgi:hypothetical protein